MKLTFLQVILFTALLFPKATFSQVLSKKLLKTEIAKACLENNNDDIIKFSELWIDQAGYSSFKNYPCYFEALNQKNDGDKVLQVYRALAGQNWFMKKYYPECKSTIEHYELYAIYFNEAFDEYNRKNYEKAIELYKKCTLLEKRSANGFYNLALCYWQMEQFEKTKQNAQKSIKLELESKYQVDCYQLINQVYRKTGILDSARYYADLSFEIEQNKQSLTSKILSEIDFKNYSTAIELGKQYQNLVDNDAYLTYLMGYSFSRIDDYKNSYLFLNRAKEMGYDTTTINLELSSIYTYYRQYDKAIELLNELIESEPQKANLYYLRANAYKNLGKREYYQNAFDNYTKAIELDPYKSAYYAYRGYIANRMDKPSTECEADFLKALKLDSSDFFTWKWYYYIKYNRQQKFSEGHKIARSCFEYYRQKAKKNSNDANAFHSISECLEWESWKYIDAPKKNVKLNCMRALVRIDTTNATYYFDLGYYYYKQNDYDSSIWCMQNAKRCYDWIVYRDYIGLCYEGKGDFETAEKIYTQTIEEHPSKSMAYQSRAFFYQRRKEFDKYRADIKMRDSLRD